LAECAARKRHPRPITWFAATANGALPQSVAELVLPIRLHAMEDLVTRESWSPPPEFRAASLAITISSSLLSAPSSAPPKSPDEPLSSPDFEEWAEVAASSLVWAGAANPLDARSSAHVAVNDDTPE
jgi:hypothetical protein